MLAKIIIKNIPAQKALHKLIYKGSLILPLTCQIKKQIKTFNIIRGSYILIGYPYSIDDM